MIFPHHFHQSQPPFETYPGPKVEVKDYFFQPRFPNLRVVWLFLGGKTEKAAYSDQWFLLIILIADSKLKKKIDDSYPYLGRKSYHKITAYFGARRWNWQAFLWQLCPLSPFIMRNPLEYRYTKWPVLSCQQCWHWNMIFFNVPKNITNSKKTLTTIGNEHKWATNDHHSQWE